MTSASHRAIADSRNALSDPAIGGPQPLEQPFADHAQRVFPVIARYIICHGLPLPPVTVWARESEDPVPL